MCIRDSDMLKQDNKFVNTSKQQHYELEDWL